MNMKHETIIIGGSGFIGGHLCVRLNEIGVPALSISRSPNTEFLAVHAPRIRHLGMDDFMQDRDAFLSQAKAVIYLASTSFPASNALTPWLENAENVAPAFELFFKMSTVNPEARLVYISSGGTVYGNSHAQPIPETAPLEPISPYGYGKLATEEAIRFLGRTRGLAYSILRVSNPIGRWQKNSMQGIVNVAWRAIENDKTLTLFDGGRQIRDFVDADDVVEAILIAAGKREIAQGVWNIGSGQATRVIDVIAMIEELAGREIRKSFADSRSVDVAYSVLDCRRAAEDLPWQASTPLWDTLKKVVPPSVASWAKPATAT